MANAWQMDDLGARHKGDMSSLKFDGGDWVRTAERGAAVRYMNRGIWYVQLTPTATKLLYSSGRPRPPFQVSSSCTRPIKLEILLHEIDTSPFCTKCPLISVIVALTLDRHVVVAPVIRLTRAQCTPYPYAILRGFSTPLATAALCGQSRARYCVHGPFKMRATVRGIARLGPGWQTRRSGRTWRS